MFHSSTKTNVSQLYQKYTYILGQVLLTSNLKGINYISKYALNIENSYFLIVIVFNKK